MSDHRKQPEPNRHDKRKDKRRKNTQKHAPAPSPQPSQTTTPGPVPSNRQGPSPGATAILPLNPKSAPRGVDEGADWLKGGDTAETDKSDTAGFMPGGARYNLSGIHGGTGGPGGQGGLQGGPGGIGEGPMFINSNVYVTTPDATKLQFIKEKLSNHITTQHKFTDQSKSLCAAGTRVDIRADINQWLSLEGSTKEHIFWVTGIAGSGKSTLSATLVDNLRKKGTPVAAQFFISRNIPDTTNSHKIIPTIAQQLAEFSPDAAHIIQDKLKNGFPSSQKEQVEALLLAPIWELSQSRTAVIILIDALDELQNASKSVPEILSLIASKDCDLPDNVRFLVTSRPEHWADISGSKTLELVVFKQHTLLTDSSVPEVNNFIIVRMKEITPNQSGWENWPPSGEMGKLSDKANGLFHYAATALHWIEGQIDEHGRSCQGWVLQNLTQEGGLGLLENLYRVILTSFENIDNPAQNVGRRKVRLASFKHVIGTILVLQEPLTISQIIALLADIPTENFDVDHFLQQMRSLLVPGTTKSFEEATPQMHKSFRDYIMDRHAPAEFRILTGHAHFTTARSCMEAIVKAGSQSNVVLEYSIQHWYKHLRKGVEEGLRWEDERMWNLFGEMVKELVVNVWGANSWQVFIDVVAVGWQLLEQGADKHRMEGIVSIVMKAKGELERYFEELDVLWDEQREQRRREDPEGKGWVFYAPELEELEGKRRAPELEELEGKRRAFWVNLWAAEKEGIPYDEIWNHGLLTTWKHSHPPLQIPHLVSGDLTLTY